jgi:hypothetical protein
MPLPAAGTPLMAQIADMKKDEKIRYWLYAQRRQC